VSVYLDTHVLVWLFEGDIAKLSVGARRAVDGDNLLVSPAAMLELELLHEIGRLHPTATKVATVLANTVGLRVCELPFWTVVEVGLREKWGRDPFDRLIVANAKVSGSALITKDQKIHQHYANAIW
jgi:PIN domain nuclease of toxin-antitoxin system